MRSPLCALVMLFVCDGLSIAQQELPYTSPADPSVPGWAQLMYAANPNPGDVIQVYEAYYLSHPFVKNAHTQYYKRWIRSISRALPPEKKGPPRRENRSTLSQWECIGPWDWDHNAVDRSYAPGAAHVYTVEQSQSNPDILYAGTATSGIWRSDDRGISWIPLTGSFRSLAVTAIEIGHHNPMVVFAELLNTIYKSTDGGIHWIPTGDIAFQQMSLDVHDIVMHPEDPNILFAATNLHLFRTTDAGNTWTSVLSGHFQEIAFHPGRPDTIYTVRLNGEQTVFYRSLDGGITFQQQTQGWPVPNLAVGEHQKRVELAVSPAAPDHVFALATGMANGGSGLYGVYKSIDAGATWSFTCCGPQPGGPPSEQNPNLMGWSDLGLDDGGQYYYDLAFAISPTNADSIFVAGVNLWVSGDGGASFICPAKWSHPHKPNYVHADIHDIQFSPATHEIWLACDGGIFYSPDNGANFHRRMYGITGTDFWGFGAGFWDGEVILGGTYHNGTLLCDHDVFENGWISTDGGDNYRGFVNPGKPNQVYTDYNIKTLSGNRTVTCPTRTFTNKPNASYIVGQSSDMLFHPNYFGTWYTGSGTKLWRTDDDGYTFTQVHDFGQAVAAMDISRSNPNVIYVCTFPDWWGIKRIYRTDDGGQSWINITPSSGILGGDTWIPYDIAVDATDAYRVWIVRTSMYGETDLSGRCVFRSDNGGLTWQNLSTPSLDGEAFTCIAHQAGTDGGAYLGTRETVYYRNQSMSDWVEYGDGLPAATFSTKLVPYYRKGKIRNGTNHSVWETAFYENSHPLAQPSVVARQHNCAMDTVYFMDHSILNEANASWLWYFPGGTPSTSTERNPKVVYHEPGIYDVTLTVSDLYGTDTRTVDNLIEVRNWCALDTVPGWALKCTTYPDYGITPDLNLTGNTFTISAWVKPEGIQSNYAAIIMSDDVACGLNFRESNNTLGYHWAGSNAAWSWDSNLEVPPDKWSHVAMVVSPLFVKLYVNGKEATHLISHPEVTIRTMKVGNYQGWQARNFKGLIDEVCIWDRALPLHEIRALRHLTKDPEDDPHLMLYYQFNEESSVIYDKNQLYHGWLNGNAVRVRSRAPVGSGVSASREVLLPGTYTFGETGLTMTFGFLTDIPLGPVYVTRLNALPDTVAPPDVPYTHGYWILNNYGLIQNIGAPESVVLENIAFISNAMHAELGNKLLARTENAELGSWQVLDTEDGITAPGENGSITFESLTSSYHTLGQLFVVRDSMLLGRPLTALVHEPDTGLTHRGGSSAAFAVQSASRGVLLPKYTAEALQQIPSPHPGSLVYLSDSSALAIFNGMSWQVLKSEYLQPPEYTGLPAVTGMSLGGGSVASGLLGMGHAAGVLVLPGFEGANIAAIDFPKEGLIVYREDIGRLAYFDGIDWISVGEMASPLPASFAEPSVSLPGMRIGPGTKDPNAVLHILDPQRGLALPVTVCRNVLSPQAGLIIFDSEIRKLTLFDGVGWKMVR